MAASSRSDSVLPIGLALMVIFFSFISVNLVRSELYARGAALYWAVDVLKFVVLPLVVAITLATQFGVTPRQYGFVWNGWLDFSGLLVLCLVLMFLTYRGGTWIAWVALRFPEAHRFYASINPSGVLRLPVTLYFAITAGVVEETFFRGLPLLFLERLRPSSVPKAAYVLGTATCFSLVHWMNGPHEVAGTWLLGIVTAALYLRIRTLWPLIAAHSLIDLLDFGWAHAPG